MISINLNQSNNCGFYSLKTNIQFVLTLKRPGGQIPPCVFSKMYLLKRGRNPDVFVTFNIIINHIFPENFLQISQVVQGIWRISLSILAIFIDFHRLSGFLTLLCYKETNDVSLQQMMSAFFKFQHAFNRLFNNCIKLY